MASARSFFLSAFGHSWLRMRQQRALVTGIDIHRPLLYVPVLGVRHLDETLPTAQIRELIVTVWPRILTTSGAKLALFHGLFSLVPESLDDLIRMAETKHVVLAERSPAVFHGLIGNKTMRVQILTLTRNEQIDGGINVRCRTARDIRGLRS